MPHSARNRRTPSRSGIRETQRRVNAAGKRPPTRHDGPHSGLDQALAAAAAVLLDRAWQARRQALSPTA